VNALEFDPDLTPCHVSPFVLPVPWTTAEHAERSGRDLLTALVVAHEVAAQLSGRMPGLRQVGGTARRPTYRFQERWSAYNAGIVGAVLGAAHLRETDASTASSAVGIAAGFAPVPLSSRFFFTARPSDQKYGSPGWVSLAAITALDLATAGYRGDAEAIAGPNGMLSVLGNGPADLAGAAADLGRHWRVRDTVFKRYPTGGVSHVGLDLFERFLTETGTPPGTIEEVRVTSDPIVEVPVLANREVSDEVDAQFALAWGFALLPYYPPGPVWQSPVALRDPRVRRLFSRVRVTADRAVVRDLYRQLVTERLPYVRRRPTRIVVRAVGTVWERSDTIADGYPERPLSEEELRAKFLLNAQGHLSDIAANQLFATLISLDRCGSLEGLAATLRRARARPEGTA
jgi:2-methylcitrate dehydratase PrpD